MSEVSRKKIFGFQAKVLFPVVAILVLLLASIMWLVNRRLVDELQDEATQNLTIAQAVFRNSFDIRARNLLLRFELLANEPRFRAVAQLAEPKTMTVQLKELLDETGPDTRIMIFTMDKDRLLAGVSRESEVNLQEFRAHCSNLISKALEGQAGTDTIALGNRLFNVISVPVIAENNLVGVLAIGVNIGSTAAQELKSLTRSEVVFMANNAVAASTFHDVNFYPHLVELYKQLTKSSQNPHSTPLEVSAPDGEHFLCLARTFTRSETDDGYLLLTSYESALRKSASTQQILTILSIAGIFFSSLLIWILIRQVTRPLRELRRSAEAVGGGDFSQRVPVQSNDELGELATVFNRMMENLTTSRETLKNTQAQLVQSEKLSAIGEFVAGVAHELNNPLTGVIGFSQMLQESGISDRQQSFLDRIVGSAERCHKIVQSLLSFSRRRQPERKIISLNELVQTTVELSKYELKAASIDVTMDLAPDIPPISADPAQIQQVFVNILNNARHAIQEKGQPGNIQVTTKLVGGKARIEFRDNGRGIPKEHLDKIFNPFFTTKPVGEGTGLGLSLSYGIIHEHGGTIAAESVAGKGAIFTIDLPMSSSAHTSAVPSAPERAAISNPPNGSRKILVIDDEENILELIQEVLTTTGHQVELATTGNAALQLVRDRDYDLIICDWKIPGMNGKQIYAELQKLDPAKARKFLFVTGNVLSPETEQFLRTERTPYLLKPFSVTQLRKTVENLLRVSS